MTDFQRKKVMTMRGNNESYTTIANATGLSVGSVKMFCQRNNICPGFKRCKECGESIPKGYHEFCSAKCRNAWWKENKKEIYKKEYTFVCNHCNKTFVRFRNDHPKYCSHECYIAERYNKEVKNGQD